METWSASLGVDCEYCHPGSDWSSEENVNKLLARQMYRSGLELDRTYFGEGGRITCWTCHRGEAVPTIRLPGGAIP
jgi:photosynthetic reaction center cytochrome c subunit